MHKELTTIEALDGEYIAAGEPEQTFTAEDSISDQAREALKRQAEGMRNMQGIGGLGGAAAQGFGSIFGF